MIHKDIKNPSQLASQLGYDNPEKIGRLFRKEDALPSAEILIDITNKFGELNIKWLLTGSGRMLNTGKQEYPENLMNSSMLLTESNFEYNLAQFQGAAKDVVLQSLGPLGHFLQQLRNDVDQLQSKKSK